MLWAKMESSKDFCMRLSHKTNQLKIRKLKTFSLMLFLAFGMTGCFRPLYGSPEFGGLAIQKGLAGVNVEVGGERLAHYLRNELEFGLRGDGDQSGPRTHRLTVLPRTRLNTAIVDRVSGSAESVVFIIDAQFKLIALDKATVELLSETATVAVPYERSNQRFASIRAARDAEIRAAKQVAEQIKTRVAAYLASNR
jgi:LPS-assembly lipoprotein